MTDPTEPSFNALDERTGPELTDFDSLSAPTRRDLLRGGFAFGAAAFVMGATNLARTSAATRLGFDAVPANTMDTITLPRGYSWHIVAKWGDPLWSNGADFDQSSRGTGASQELSFGDYNDGMALFTVGDRRILAVNNESTNLGAIYGNRQSKRPESADDIRKGKAAHGISIVEIRQNDGRWSIVRDSPYNRRITADTPMEITGPARGHELLRTAADPSGTTSLGTWNNCGSGRTPWGTYLSCEENFDNYFASSDKAFQPTEAMKRYGLSPNDQGYGWATIDQRFDISRHPNEANRAGYVVEIDPLDPTATPRKRTALGRFKHENAEVVVANNGHVVVYMGDDEWGEFLYRFVSDGKYLVRGDNSDLLESGKLSVAKFSDNMRGEWIELTPATTAMASRAEIRVHTRQAASSVRATTMDRPEWIATSPNNYEVYCSLTNNHYRGIMGNAGGDETPVFGPNPRLGNDYGQIVRWLPDNTDHTAEGFTWDLFVLAGNPTAHSDAYAGSENVTAENFFNSPDGLAFDSLGLLWIQTDGNYSNEGDFAGMGNNQMLVGDPGSGEIKRFMVGPRECEVTGMTWSPDRKTLFVGIQHPGEQGGSHFPEGGQLVPRSAVIGITRDDGRIIG